MSCVIVSNDKSQGSRVVLVGDRGLLLDIVVGLSVTTATRGLDSNEISGPGFERCFAAHVSTIMEVATDRSWLTTGETERWAGSSLAENRDLHRCQ